MELLELVLLELELNEEEDGIEELLELDLEELELEISEEEELL